MRAASFGTPFQPIPAGAFQGSDLPRVSGFKLVQDPYSGAEVFAIPRLEPDWAVIHVNQADALGNARVSGSPFWDEIMTRAARRVIVVAEEIVPTAVFEQEPALTLVPHFMVEAVVHLPGGARPCSCFPDYGIDEAGMRRYLEESKTVEGLHRYLAAEAERDHAGAARGGALT